MFHGENPTARDTTNDPKGPMQVARVLVWAYDLVSGDCGLLTARGACTKVRAYLQVRIRVIYPSTRPTHGSEHLDLLVIHSLEYARTVNAHAARAGQ